MTTQEETVPDTRPTHGDGDDKNLVHTYCCMDEFLGLCGRNLEGMNETDDDEPECIVCEDIADAPDVCKVCPTTLKVLGLWNGS